MATSGRAATAGTMKFYIGDGKDSVGSACTVTDDASFSSSNNSNSSASDAAIGKLQYSLRPDLFLYSGLTEGHSSQI